jgi:hypothetical protein
MTADGRRFRTGGAWDIIEYHENKRTGGLYRDNEKSEGI